MKLKKMLAVILTMAMVLTTLPVTAFADDTGAVLSGSGTAESPYMIYDLDDLVVFRNSVNDGKTDYNRDGAYVALGADIDMKGVDWSVNIGDDCNFTFDGIFDGNGYTIYNLESTETAEKGNGYICTGLFGAIYENAVIKNLTIENVSINTGEFTGNNVGAVAGFVYNGTGSIENVTVCGDIKINAADVSGAGAIVGYAYGGNLTVENCTVSGNTDSYIQGAAFTGGVIGYAGGKTTIKNCVVENVDIEAKCCVGGVAGILLNGGEATGNTVKNITVTAKHENWQNSAAAVVGTITGEITVSGTTVNTVKIKDDDSVKLVGSVYADKPTSPVKGIEAGVNNKYKDRTFAEAVKDAEAGATITLQMDAEGAGIVIDKNITIDFGGNTYTFTTPAVGSTGTTTNGFQILKGNNVVLKNGGLKVADANAKEYYILIQNYANLTVNSMTLDGRNLDKWSTTDGDSYVLSNNSGTVSIEDTKIIKNDNGDKAFAFDVCKYASYEPPVVTISGDVVVDGAFEVSEGLEKKLTINGGHFTQDPTDYVPEDKQVIPSTVSGYTYMVVTPTVADDVSSTVVVQDPKVDIADGVEITPDELKEAVTKEETVEKLNEIAAEVEIDTNDVTEAKEELGVEDSADIIFVVKPCMNVEIKGYENYELTLEIEPTYTLTAVNKNDPTQSHDLKKDVPMEVPMGVSEDEAIEITIPLPTGFAENLPEIFITHIKEGGRSFLYKATVNDGGKTATFKNPNGFSTFKASAEAPVMNIVQIEPCNGLPGTVVQVASGVEFTVDMPAPEKGTNGDNAVFLGWFINGVEAPAKVKVTEPVIKIEAKWEAPYVPPTLHTVTVKYENGDPDGKFEIASGEEFTVDTEGFIANPTKDGYTFIRWDKTLPITVTGDITITAQWTYNGGSRGGSGGGGGSSTPSYAASVDSSSIANGTVKLSNTKAAAGAAVTITVTPDAGYALAELKVLDKDGNKVEVKDNGDGTYTFVMPEGGVKIDASFAAEKAKTTLVLTIGNPVYQLDGNSAANDVAPIIQGDRTMLPIRLIAETLGATVTWNEADRSVTIVKDDTTIVIYIDQATALVNGDPVQLDAPAFIANDRTYLPLRFVSETLGANVTWDGEARTVTIVG